MFSFIRVVMIMASLRSHRNHISDRQSLSLTNWLIALGCLVLEPQVSSTVHFPKVKLGVTVPGFYAGELSSSLQVCTARTLSTESSPISCWFFFKRSFFCHHERIFSYSFVNLFLITIGEKDIEFSCYASILMWLWLLLIILERFNILFHCGAVFCTKIKLLGIFKDFSFSDFSYTLLFRKKH